MPPTLLAIQEEIQQCRLQMHRLSARLEHLENIIIPEIASYWNKDSSDLPESSNFRPVGGFTFPEATDSRPPGGTIIPIPDASWTGGASDRPEASNSGHLLHSGIPQTTGGWLQHGPMRVEITTSSSSLPTDRHIATILRREEAGMTRPTTQYATARLLLHLLAQPTGNSHGTLAAIMGLTVSGTAKHMMAMRRRALVERRGYQHYVPSAKAMGYLQKAALLRRQEEAAAAVV